MLTQMITVGEETGALEDILVKLPSFMMVKLRRNREDDNNARTNSYNGSCSSCTIYCNGIIASNV